MSLSSGLWGRIRGKYLQWQHRYEYPEAHRSPPPNSATAGGSDQNTVATSSILESEEWHSPHLNLQDHPLHRNEMRYRLKRWGSFLFYTAVHAVAIYVMYVYVWPQIIRLRGSPDTDTDEDDDTDDPPWKKFVNKFSRGPTGTCCCCDGKVSTKDKFCPSCGTVTSPMCLYCGTTLRSNVNFCNSCGKPVPNQVIVDGGAETRMQPSAPFIREQQNSSSPLSTRSISQLAAMPVPYMAEHLCDQKEDVRQSSAVIETEDVPIVQAESDASVPLVQAMYVEEVNDDNHNDAEDEHVDANIASRRNVSGDAFSAGSNGEDFASPLRRYRRPMTEKEKESWNLVLHQELGRESNSSLSWERNKKDLYVKILLNILERTGHCWHRVEDFVQQTVQEHGATLASLKEHLNTFPAIDNDE